MLFSDLWFLLLSFYIFYLNVQNVLRPAENPKHLHLKNMKLKLCRKLAKAWKRFTS